MNVWDVQQTFVKQEANDRRTFMTNRMGGDLSANTGRKEKWTDGVAAMKSILEGYETLPKQELITMLAPQAVGSRRKQQKCYDYL